MTRLLSERLDCHVMLIVHGPQTGIEILENFVRNLPMEFGLLDLARLTIAQRMQQELGVTNTAFSETQVKEGVDQHMAAVAPFDKKKAN